MNILFIVKKIDQITYWAVINSEFRSIYAPHCSLWTLYSDIAPLVCDVAAQINFRDVGPILLQLLAQQNQQYVVDPIHAINLEVVFDN